MEGTKKVEELDGFRDFSIIIIMLISIILIGTWLCNSYGPIRKLISNKEVQATVTKIDYHTGAQGHNDYFVTVKYDTLPSDFEGEKLFDNVEYELNNTDLYESVKLGDKITCNLNIFEITYHDKTKKEYDARLEKN